LSQSPGIKHRFQAELQTRRADFADDLKIEHREQLALNNYLAQLDLAPTSGIWGKAKKNPADIDAAVSATLELEAYTTPKLGGLLSWGSTQKIRRRKSLPLEQ
jgi:hypothetical protein